MENSTVESENMFAADVLTIQRIIRRECDRDECDYLLVKFLDLLSALQFGAGAALKPYESEAAEGHGFRENIEREFISAVENAQMSEEAKCSISSTLDGIFLYYGN